MIDTSIYKLILILSTDYFSEKILAHGFILKHDKIKEISKNFCSTILNNGSNYYLNANFTQTYINSIKINYFKELKENIDLTELKFVHFLFKSLESQHSYNFSYKQRFEINEYCNRLGEEFYYLTENHEKIFNENIDFFIGYYILSDNYAHISEISWINSFNEDDKYILSIMEDTPEAICHYYNDMILPSFFKLIIFDFIKDLDFEYLVNQAIQFDEDKKYIEIINNFISNNE